ncbi:MULTISPECIES: 4-oxalomesaconate tautomerase [unclassified Marinobacterium]|uniref:4-oxalomesaconate tautomerase n=1 Tax=unclassified Marinobacterium TaxID=2644139 RepID=UPI00156899D0|nr:MULTISPECIES: 4-oxalomesaconate tautomerase [unclassified Marinobacterium]NRP09836.1 4-oxalomesaconate tautomerase [Marinobacterium sp. xm-g-48]NRP28099.1 4-oxalomesaconate tautomerase [Marinobacterium sp. xm-d-420]NRP56970.1 4-oxalomesaconate tautomerase [Marinobacterium sp. xm-d-510]NRP82681.1 4-oxalomesaconate tautomerase [Marinobacterium sp. xm-d-509]NRP97780.1 4-oxalomesaconate tautomerase [Marinobacterium sp. xm-a-127]
MSNGIRCMWMRGGTSKGGYFLKSDLPSDTTARDAFLLGMMGSPDPRQIDGLGGADPLTSKVAVVSASDRDDADVDYLFLQAFVDQAIVTDAQNCGNILAGIGPFAIERGLVQATGNETQVRIFMENTGQIAIATVATPNGQVSYKGDSKIDGVPGTSAAVPLEFLDTAGSSCGALLPTGNAVDLIDGVECTLIDNGMPVVVMRASDMGITGSESREELEANSDLRAKLEAIRLQAGPMMNLGDVTEKSVPKMSMVSEATDGGALSTRTFIPHRCHASIGVLGAVSVATAAILPNSPAASVATLPEGTRKTLAVEHPIGEMTVVIDIDQDGQPKSAALLRTARKLFDGEVFAE